MKNIKEMLKAVVVICLFVFLIFSCSVFRKAEDKNTEEKSVFCKIEDNPYWTIYYHKETKVMWIRSKNSFGGEDFTVLVDSNGVPMIWNEAGNE